MAHPVRCWPTTPSFPLTSALNLTFPNHGALHVTEVFPSPRCLGHQPGHCRCCVCAGQTAHQAGAHRATHGPARFGRQVAGHCHRHRGRGHQQGRRHQRQPHRDHALRRPVAARPGRAAHPRGPAGRRAGGPRPHVVHPVGDGCRHHQPAQDAFGEHELQQARPAGPALRHPPEHAGRRVPARRFYRVSQALPKRQTGSRDG